MNLDRRDELTELFEQYQNLLTQTQKQTMHLYLVEDLSFQEIADILAVSRQAVNDAIRKSEKKLLTLKKQLG